MKLASLFPSVAVSFRLASTQSVQTHTTQSRSELTSHKHEARAPCVPRMWTGVADDSNSSPDLMYSRKHHLLSNNWLFPVTLPWISPKTTQEWVSSVAAFTDLWLRRFGLGSCCMNSTHPRGVCRLNGGAVIGRRLFLCFGLHQSTNIILGFWNSLSQD